MIERDKLLKLGKEAGSTHYSTPPMRAVTGIAFTYEALERFAALLLSSQANHPPLDQSEQYRMQMAAISSAALGYWKIGQDIQPEYVTVALKDVAKLYDKYETARAQAAVPEGLLEWAIERWTDEVAHRPLSNAHRRTLDDVWRQVIRYAGGDDVLLVGPRHDDLVAAHR